MNGRRVATSKKQFHNYCCFKKIPRIIMMFLSNPQASLNYVAHPVIYVTYFQWKRYIYIHSSKQYYAISVVVGLMVASFLWCVIVLNIQLPTLSSTTIPSNHYIKQWIRNACGNSYCVKELGVYPNVFFIRSTKNITIKGCDKLQKGVVKCVIE